MRITRFYFGDSLKTDSIVKLRHELTHYVVKVLRLKTGNQIKLFNNNEGEFLGTIVSIKKGDISVSVDLQVRVPSEDSVRFHIALSIIKGERMDYAIQKAVELGVTSLTPLYSRFSEVKIKNKNHLENCTISANCIIGGLLPHFWKAHLSNFERIFDQFFH